MGTLQDPAMRQVIRSALQVRGKDGQDGLKASDDQLSLKVPKSRALLSHR